MEIDFTRLTQFEILDLINKATHYLDRGKFNRTYLYVEGANSQLPESKYWWDEAK